MEASVAGVGVFRCAIPAHFEGCHRRIGAVVGDIRDDREPGPAIGTVDEGIPVAPVAWIEHFCQAVIAYADVGRYRLKGSLLAAGFSDLELCESARRGLLCIERLDGRPGGTPPSEIFDEGIQGGTGSVYLNIYTRGCIAYPAGQCEAFGQQADVWPESDALYDAGDMDLAAFHPA